MHVNYIKLTIVNRGIYRKINREVKRKIKRKIKEKLAKRAVMSKLLTAGLLLQRVSAYKNIFIRPVFFYNPPGHIQERQIIMEIPQLLDDGNCLDADDAAFAVVPLQRRQQDGIKKFSYFLVVLPFYDDKQADVSAVFYQKRVKDIFREDAFYFWFSPDLLDHCVELDADLELEDVADLRAIRPDAALSVIDFCKILDNSLFFHLFPLSVDGADRDSSILSYLVVRNPWIFYQFPKDQIFLMVDSPHSSPDGERRRLALTAYPGVRIKHRRRD